MRRPTATKPVAARVFAGVAAVFWGWLFFGVQDTLTVFVEGKDFSAHYLMESGWGLLFLLLVAAPLAGLVWRPRASVLTVQVAAVGLAVVTGAILAGSVAHLVPGGGLLLTAAAVTALRGRGPASHRLHPDPPLAALTLAAAAPALAYAWRMAHSDAGVEQTVNLDHYPIQSALGIALLLVAALVALTTRWPMAWLATATLGVTVGWMGVESIVYPHLQGSFGARWGWLAAGWAVTFSLLALRQQLARRETQRDSAMASQSVD